MIDLHHNSERFDKLMMLKFSADCQTGWSEKKLTIARIIKLLVNMKSITEMIEKDWDWITKDDVRDLLDKIDRTRERGMG